jgi:hypothetical protein
MFTRDDILTRVIPHRLEAIATLNLVLRLLGGWDSPKPMKIFFADRLKITGSSSAFTNPVIEAGIIHCRALLEFLGLRVSPSDPRKLASRGAKGRTDDWVIEDFSNAAGALPLVTPQQAVSRYKGGPAEAETALASVLHTANKGLAHLTAGLSPAATDITALEIASRGVPALVVSYLYTPLGLPAPTPSISSTTGDDGYD